MNLSKFAERLKEYMDEHGLNAPALAREIGAERSTINGLLRGAFAPSTEHFMRLAEYFDCSADYLLGLDEIPKRETKFLPVQPIAPRIRALLERDHISQYRLRISLNVSSSVTYRWLTGKSVPTVESLVKLARFFACSLDDLLGRVA